MSDEQDNSPLTPYGEQIAAEMDPQTAANYWRQQSGHWERRHEELQAAFEKRMQELGDAHATIRTLVKMAREIGMGGLW
jgi:hypothetical protein